MIQFCDLIQQRNIFLGKKIFTVSKPKNRQKIQTIAIYNIHTYIQNKNRNKQHTT